MDDNRNLIGQTLNSAEKELKDKIYRIVKRDSENMTITDDFLDERLNLEIENGIITKIYKG